MSVIGFFYRVKFYAAWYLTQTTINVSGLSYSENGKNDSVVTGSIMFEFEPNPKNKTEYWNSSVQLWLKTIIYDNIAALTKNQTLAVFGTFFTSAFWHGIYLSYYLGKFFIDKHRFYRMGNFNPTNKILLQSVILLSQIFPLIFNSHSSRLAHRHYHDELYWYDCCCLGMG